MPSDKIDLEAIRARVEAATPGPWKAHGHAHMVPGCRCLSCDQPTVGWTLDNGKALCCEGKAVDGAVTCDESTPLLSPVDVDFAVHAREDVPALLAEVDRLRTEVREMADWAGVNVNKARAVT